MKQSIRRKQGKEGIATIWTMLFFLVLVMFVGLVVDTGYLALARQQMQTVADASALSGAYTVKTNAVASRMYARNIGGMNYAAGVYVDLQLNGSNDPLGDIVIGKYDRTTATFTPTMVRPNAIQTNPRRTNAHVVNNPVDLIFGDIMGNPQQEVAAMAIAKMQGGLGTGVIVLNEEVACAFDIRGTPSDFEVNNGVIYVNSDNPEAVCHSGQPTIDTSEIYVVGGTDRNYEQVDLTGEIIFTDEIVPDPLANLPDPFYDVTDDGVEINNSQATWSPGYYSEGLTLNNGEIHLEPGVYILDGAGLNITGGDFYAPGCIFFIIDSTPGDPKPSSVDITGNGIIRMGQPDTAIYSYPVSPDITPYAEAGVTIFQARDNTNDSRILGTADTDLGGTIYMPKNHIEIGGTSDNIATGLIADTVELHGNGLMTINYDGRFGVIPPNVYLVQ